MDVLRRFYRMPKAERPDNTELLERIARALQLLTAATERKKQNA